MTGLFTFLKFLADNWKPIAVVFLVAAVFAAGHHLGASSTQAQCDAITAKRDIAEQAATISAQAAARAKEHADNQETNEVSNVYEKRVSVLDGLYAGALAGVQQSPAITAASGVPVIPAGKPGHNAAACTAGLSRRDKAVLISIAKQADEQTARLVACQQWIAVHEPAPVTP